MRSPRLRVRALLHDPSRKACPLYVRPEWVREVLDRAGAGRPGADVDQADRMAAAADRVELPERDSLIARFRHLPEIVHPLTGRTVELPGCGELRALEIEQIVHEVLDGLVDESKSEGDRDRGHERLATLVWRRLPERLAERTRDLKLAHLWEWLPADARIPDHSIWDHQRLTTAFAVAGEEPAILLFHLGPVPEVLEACRTLDELRDASRRIAAASWAAMKVVVNRLGPESILFPDLYGHPVVDRDLGLSDGEGQASFPNRFEAVVPSSEAASLAEEAARAAAGFETWTLTLPWPAALGDWEETARTAGVPVRELEDRAARIRGLGFWSPGRGALYGELLRTGRRVLDASRISRSSEAPSPEGNLRTSTSGSDPFAVIVADGDGMTELLSDGGKVFASDTLHRYVRERLGDRARTLDKFPRSASPAFHATLGRILRGFSREVAPDIVDGELIHSGGDDLLAVVPVDKAVAVAQALRRAWSGDEESEFTLGGWTFSGGCARRGDDRFLLMMGANHTMSAGIAFNDGKQPVGATLRAARRALRSAKSAGKDALGLAFTGRPTRVVSWRAGGEWAADLVADLRSMSRRELPALRRFEPPPDSCFKGPFAPLLGGRLATFAAAGGFRDGGWPAMLDLIAAEAR